METRGNTCNAILYFGNVVIFLISGVSVGLYLVQMTLGVSGVESISSFELL